MAEHRAITPILFAWLIVGVEVAGEPDHQIVDLFRFRSMSECQEVVRDVVKMLDAETLKSATVKPHCTSRQPRFWKMRTGGGQ